MVSPALPHKKKETTERKAIYIHSAPVEGAPLTNPTFGVSKNPNTAFVRTWRSSDRFRRRARRFGQDCRDCSGKGQSRRGVYDLFGLSGYNTQDTIGRPQSRARRDIRITRALRDRGISISTL